MSNQRNIIVIGGGAAGMIAAIAAAKEGCAVSLYEKNEKLGKKIFITGKGRCNVTNAGDMDELFAAVITNKKFMFSSFYGFTNEDMMQFLEDAGLRLKTERKEGIPFIGSFFRCDRSLRSHIKERKCKSISSQGSKRFKLYNRRR